MSAGFLAALAVEATGGALARGGEALGLAGVAIDSRAVRAGELFFALRAARDGHAFAEAAVAAGAGGVVVERGRAAEAGGAALVIEVDDPRRALGALAGALRRRAAARVVAVTGSAGKTTTKEMLAAVLAAAVGDPARVLRTEGNLNNDLGVPLTLARLDPALHAYAVVELGMSARGEIAQLTALAAPEVGVITCVAPAHLATLGTLEEVAHAKGELFAGLPEGGWAVLPDDDPLLAAEAAAVPEAHRVRFGSSRVSRARILGTRAAGDAATQVTMALGDETVEVELAFLGEHNVRDAAAAAAAALALGVAPAAIARGLAAARPARMRSQVERLAGRRVLVDCYNANPASMQAALRALAEARGHGRAVAVLGDMLELGPRSAELHAEVGAYAAALGVDGLVTVGALAHGIAAGARLGGMARDRVQETEDRPEAARLALAATGAGDWILVKGSRGARLEAVVEALRAGTGG